MLPSISDLAYPTTKTNVPMYKKIAPVVLMFLRLMSSAASVDEYVAYQYNCVVHMQKKMVWIFVDPFLYLHLAFHGFTKLFNYQ